MQRNLFSEFANFAPDEGGGGGVTATPPAGSAGTSPPPPAATPESTPPPASPAASPPATQPAAAGSPDGTPAAAPPPPASPSWLDALRKDNLSVVGKDETETLANIRRMHEERQLLEAVRPMLPTLRAYQQQAPEYQKWLASQKQQPAPAANEPAWKKFFNPPEFNPAWMQMVTKDANGNLTPIAGAPPGIVDKIQNYVAYQQEEVRKLAENPLAYMDPYIEQRATEIATKIFNQNNGQSQARTQASTFVEQNAGWLYDIDQATGRPRQQIGIDPHTGQQVAVPLLSTWGQKFKGYAEEEFKFQQQRGYHDDARIQQYAFAMVQRDFAIDQAQKGHQPPSAPAAVPGQPQKTAQQIANEAFIAKNNPVKPPATAAGATVPAEETVTRQNIRQIMMREMAAAGINNQTLQNAN